MSRHAFQYVVLRCVPRVDREEFINVGVVLFCHATDFLGAASAVDTDRLRALAPEVDLDRVLASLAFAEAVCAGDGRVGSAALATMSQRFGFLKAPRSTAVQPGPVHGGLTEDAGGQLGHLLERLVR